MISHTPKHQWLSKTKDPKLIELYQDLEKYWLLYRHYDHKLSAAYALHCKAQAPKVVKTEEALPWDQ